MFSVNITPRVGEVDALGHINNCVIPFWFELARGPLFRVFNPALNFNRESWRIMVVHTDFDYVQQMYCNNDVEVRTFVTNIGNKSFAVRQEGFQNGRLCVKGNCVMVYYDFIKEASERLPDDIRAELQKHFV